MGYYDKPCIMTENELSYSICEMYSIVRTMVLLNQTIWIEDGTLLGFFKYGSILPWDGDIDLSRMKYTSESMEDKLAARFMMKISQREIINCLGSVVGIVCNSKFGYVKIDLERWELKKSLFDQSPRIWQPDSPELQIIPSKQIRILQNSNDLEKLLNQDTEVQLVKHFHLSTYRRERHLQQFVKLSFDPKEIFPIHWIIPNQLTKETAEELGYSTGEFFKIMRSKIFLRAANLPMEFWRKRQQNIIENNYDYKKNNWDEIYHLYLYNNINCETTPEIAWELLKRLPIPFPHRPVEMLVSKYSRSFLFNFPYKYKCYNVQNFIYYLYKLIF
ncbi:hypothetical protein SNEBB_007329 [Seison nebaliae]|nr:hypothetical protein SNEBB_007329 [Seison nebaliae]